METDTGNKYQDETALPLETILYTTFAPNVAPIVHERFGIKPNHITFVNGVMVGLLIIYLLLKKNYKMASILLIVRQMFDALDGYIARKYNLTSSFGAKMDVYSDRVLLLFVNLFILYKLWGINKLSSIIYLIFVSVIDILIKKKLKCIKKEIDVCKNEKNRTEILKLTRELSLMELVIIKSVLIYSFSYYK